MEYLGKYMMRDLQFYDGSVLNDKLYFSSIEYNGLFYKSINSDECVFLGHFKGMQPWQSSNHWKVKSDNTKLFFSSIEISGLDIYDTKTGFFSNNKLIDKDRYIRISNMLLWGEGFILVPLYLNKPIYFFDHQRNELKVMEDLSREVHSLLNKEDDSSDIFGSYIDGDVLYISIKNSEICFGINLITKEKKVYCIPKFKISNLILFDKKLWFTSAEKHDSRIATVDIYDNRYKFYEVKSELVSGSPYALHFFSFIPFRDSLILTQRYSSHSWFYDREDDKWIRLCDIIELPKEFHRIIDGPSMMAGYTYWGDRLCILPRSGNGILELPQQGYRARLMSVRFSKEFQEYWEDVQICKHFDTSKVVNMPVNENVNVNIKHLIRYSFLQLHI